MGGGLQLISAHIRGELNQPALVPLDNFERCYSHKPIENAGMCEMWKLQGKTQESCFLFNHKKKNLPLVSIPSDSCTFEEINPRNTDIRDQTMSPTTFSQIFYLSAFLALSLDSFLSELSHWLQCGKEGKKGRRLVYVRGGQTFYTACKSSSQLG